MNSRKQLDMVALTSSLDALLELGMTRRRKNVPPALRDVPCVIPKENVSRSVMRNVKTV